MIVSENGVIRKDGIRLENPFESGYTTGYGIFETVYVNNGEPLFLQEHYNRMKKSLPALKLADLPEYTTVREWCDDYLKELSAGSGMKSFSGKLRINWVKRGNFNADMHIYGDTFSYPREWYENGISSCFSEDVYFSGSKLDSIKTLSYAENIVEKSNAMENGYQEALRLNSNGDICEGTVSNVFWVKANILCTPALDTGALPGIIRQWVIEKAQGDGIETIETTCGKASLDEVDVIFFTNSLMGIMPVSLFENRKIETLEDKTYLLLRDKYLKLLEK